MREGRGDGGGRSGEGKRFAFSKLVGVGRLVVSGLLPLHLPLRRIDMVGLGEGCPFILRVW